MCTKGHCPVSEISEQAQVERLPTVPPPAPVTFGGRNIDRSRPASQPGKHFGGSFLAAFRKLIRASYQGLGDLPIFRRAGGDGESPVGFQPKPAGRQAGQARHGGWVAWVVEGIRWLINLKRTTGHAHALPVGRVCHRCQVSKSAECNSSFAILTAAT